MGRGAFTRLTRARRPRIGQPLVNHKQPVIKYDEASFNDRLIACQLISSGENGVSRVPMERRRPRRASRFREASARRGTAAPSCRRDVSRRSAAERCATLSPENAVSFRKDRNRLTSDTLRSYEARTRRRKTAFLANPRNPRDRGKPTARYNTINTVLRLRRNDL